MDKRCGTCKRWSELVAESIGGGPLRAMCENPKSEKFMLMLDAKKSCQAYEAQP